MLTTFVICPPKRSPLRACVTHTGVFCEKMGVRNMSHPTQQFPSVSSLGIRVSLRVSPPMLASNFILLSAPALAHLLTHLPSQGYSCSHTLWSLSSSPPRGPLMVTYDTNPSSSPKSHAPAAIILAARLGEATENRSLPREPGDLGSSLDSG